MNHSVPLDQYGSKYYGGRTAEIPKRHCPIHNETLLRSELFSTWVLVIVSFGETTAYPVDSTSLCIKYISANYLALEWRGALLTEVGKYISKAPPTLTCSTPPCTSNSPQDFPQSSMPREELHDLTQTTLRNAYIPYILPLSHNISRLAPSFRGFPNDAAVIHQ